MFEISAAAFDHQHAKNFVIDVALDERSGASQHFIEIQRRVNAFADFGERCQHFGGKRSIQCFRAPLQPVPVQDSLRMYLL